MSDDSDQEKTEQPTEKRLKESREKGEVPRSRDLSGAAVVLAGVAALMAGGPASFEHARRIFAFRGLVELGKALLKLLFIGAVLALLLRHWQGALQATGRGAVSAGIAQALGLLGQAALWFGSILALIGGLDALYQKYDHTKKLRMSRQEIKDEMKESEGSPEMKGRIRQVQMAQARRRMMEELPKADVVVVN